MLIQEGELSEPKAVNNPTYFTDSKIAELEARQEVLQLMRVDSSSERADFEAQATDIMYRIEGISHFSIDNFYTFDYLTNEALLFDYSYEKILTKW